MSTSPSPDLSAANLAESESALTLARTQLSAGQYEAAKRSATRALRLSPNNADIHYAAQQVLSQCTHSSSNHSNRPNNIASANAQPSNDSTRHMPPTQPDPSASASQSPPQPHSAANTAAHSPSLYERLSQYYPSSLYIPKRHRMPLLILYTLIAFLLYLRMTAPGKATSELSRCLCIPFCLQFSYTAN